MPIYEYRRPDGTTFELIQSFSDPALKKDPETGVKVQRVLHAPAVHFKGKGFYNTDYGTKKRQRETAAAGEGSSSSDGASSENGSAKDSSSKDGSSKDGSSSKDTSSTSEGKSAASEKSSKDTSSTKSKSDSKPVAAAK
jgi:putative FmdB family regulatory protein